MQAPLRSTWTVILAVCSVFSLLSTPAQAFDYLEHSFFGDRACSEAQVRMLPLLKSEAHPSPDLISRYLALGLVCPLRWNTHYCKDDYKELEAALSPLSAPATESGEHSLTLGDFAALPDHLSQFGSVRGLSRAQQRGLLDEVLRLLSPQAGEPAGVIRDVAEDACETDGLVDWVELENDLGRGLNEIQESVHHDYLMPGAWDIPSRGPSDPAGAYSFDNPHYLDLVLSNHHHFGDEAYDSWAGYHAAAIAVSKRSCEEIIALDASQLEDLADGLSDYQDLEWDELSTQERQQRGCSLLAERIEERLHIWLKRADPLLVSPVSSALGPHANPSVKRALAQRTFKSLVSLVFEGAALHFLQDNVAGGHLRVNRAAHGLGMSRHLHDADGRQGVVAETETTRGRSHHILFGDSYLLGRAQSPVKGACELGQGDMPSGQVTACHLRRQRALVLTQSSASLLHWVVGGPERAELACPTDSVTKFVCDHLPIQPTKLSSRHEFGLGTLPQAPPPFAFQSLSTSLSMDLNGGGSQAGIRLVFLSALGDMADWMTSYHFGFLQTSRPYGEGYSGDESLTEFSYMFHWRWAARFLVNVGAYTYLGFQGLGHDMSVMFGVGPSIGMTLLPEGWTKIPLDISITYRIPVTLLNSRYGLQSDAIEIEGHWLEFSFGLAFM